MTATATASHTPTPTATPLLPCAADCDNDRRVAIPELQASASIFLSILGVSACPAADLDGSTRIDVTELQRAVVTFLVGCP